MVNCPICKGTENDHVFSEPREYRGKHFQYGVYHCPRCGAKFSFYTPLEVPQAEEAGEEAVGEAPAEPPSET
ncbi:MAG: hypothetical protein ACE5JE_00345 [Thermoplasmata archaeon]